MTPEQAAAASRAIVVELGEAYTRCPTTRRRARLLGISGWAFYVTARGGALGAVGSETAAACLGFIAPDAVAEGWDAAARVVAPREVAAAGLAECCRWGRQHLADAPGVTRLADLLHRAVAAAEAHGLPLFAAWRAMPVPDDAPGARAAVGLHLLRELYLDAYLLAVRVSGMTPLEAVLAGAEGEAGAMAGGWPRPYPPVGPLVRRRIWAEAATDRLVSSAFRTLGAAERVELADLLTVTHGRVRAADGCPPTGH
ncbi:SCO6745 family protein [Micromonospora echinospora]|uniref:SCO6745 family protein n=1 Tax=Micromonospora echinospora TaxID=1877 RepID=UPI003A8B5EF0